MGGSTFKTLRNVSLVVLLAAAVVGFWGYKTIFDVNTTHSEASYIYIPSGSTQAEVVDQLVKQGVLGSTGSFERVAQWMKYKTPKAGKYKIPTNLSNRDLISLLRSGRQEPVRVTFSTARTIHDIAGQLGGYVEADSLTILAALTDGEHLSKMGLTPETAITQIIPNTYEMFWTTSPEGFVERMDRESDSFWKKNGRPQKLKDLGLSQAEVMTLASIVERESQQKAERPRIAGVYLNRLRQGVKLDADPTVVFGVGDFSIRRVLYKHLRHDSPYNTYMYAGLPPGPICMPSISSIDAVLDAEEHDYMYFCAKPGYNGAHLFAKDHAQHLRNARVYHRWLSKEGIKG